MGLKIDMFINVGKVDQFGMWARIGGVKQAGMFGSSDPNQYITIKMQGLLHN